MPALSHLSSTASKTRFSRQLSSKLGRCLRAVCATFVASFAAFSFTAVIAASHDGATGVVKERMDRMSAVAKGTKTIANMLRGRSDYDAEALAAAATSIAESSAQDMIALFEEGTFDPPSEALPVILEKPDEFAQIMSDLNAAATEVAAAAAGGVEAVGPVFGKLAATCKACHQTYRAAN